MPHSEPIPIRPGAGAGSVVVVTGANGFIASHTIDRLLRQGFQVVGTVRSQSKALAVQKTHAQLSPNAHLLSTAIVSDITDPEAYTSLFRETKPVAVLHLASPFGYSTTDFEADLLQPAVRGTEAVLKAAAQTPSIRRVIHTNSFACIYDAALGPRPGYTYTSADWCPLTYSDGVNAANAAVAYRAGKAVAEKTAWEFMSSHAAPYTFDLVSLCPAMVFGPFLPTPHSIPSSLAGLNTSNQLVWSVVSAGSSAPVPPTKGPVWVDVRDVAEAHVAALMAYPNLAGKRFLLAQDVYCNQEIADVARKLEAAGKGQQLGRIPVGNPGHREAESHFGIDASREAEELGLKWKGLEDSLADLLPQLYQIAEGEERSVGPDVAK